MSTVYMEWFAREFEMSKLIERHIKTEQQAFFS